MLKLAIRLINSFELITHFLLLSLFFFSLFAKVVRNFLCQDVWHGLVPELIVRLVPFRQELSDKFMGHTRVVDSLLSNLDLVADLGKQATT